MHRLCRGTFLRDDVLGDFLLGGVASAVGRGGGDSDFAVDMFLVGIFRVVMEGLDNFIWVDLESELA